MCRECQAARKREQYAELRAQVVTEYGGACAVCGDDRLMALDLEHINNDGRVDRAGGVPNAAWLRRLLNGPKRDDLQVLCGSCHNIKTRGGDPAFYLS
jgi:5-methylcytosine-specific restriction endonuclease McrA